MPSMPNFHPNLVASWKFTFLITFIFYLAIRLTTPWVDFYEGLMLAYAQDSLAYLDIANAAPRFIEHKINMSFTQRWSAHYLFGTICKLFGVKPLDTYPFATIVMQIGFLALFARMISGLKVSRSSAFLFSAGLMMNTVLFRYYSVASGMLQDWTYYLGLVTALIGVLEKRLVWLILGCILANCGRQTGLLLLPAVAVWTFFDPAWHAKGAKYRFAGLLAAILGGAAFWTHYSIGSVFGNPGNDFQTGGMGLFMHPQYYTVGYLSNYLVRIFHPQSYFVFLVLIASLFGGRIKPMPTHVKLAAFFFICVVSQPILGGPIFGSNLTRLSSFAMPVMIVFGLLLTKELNLKLGAHFTYFHVFAIGILAFIASFHHSFSSPAWLTSGHYLASYVLMTGLILLVVFRKPRSVRETELAPAS